MLFHVFFFFFTSARIPLIINYDSSSLQQLNLIMLLFHAVAQHCSETQPELNFE